MLSNSHGHNTPRKRPLSRSKSLVGSIKSLFTGLFRTSDDHHDDFEQSKGKRRALDQSGPDVSMDRIESGSRMKRMRIGSPEPNGYLDPPASVFEQHSPSHFNFSFTPSSRLPYVSVPSPTISPANNHKPNAIPATRTMSMDPPTSRYSQHLTRDPSMSTHDEPSMATNQSNRMSVPIRRISTSVPRDSSMRDLSLPPLRSSPLRMSLTPQHFGPSPLRRERPPSEPPALTSLMSNPMFVRPPPETKHSLPDSQSTVTLGSLVDSQRSTRSPARTHSALFSSQSSISEVSSTRKSSSPAPLLPPLIRAEAVRINPAEKLLNDLEAYRTPFLPSRLRDSSTANIVPGMSMYERGRSGTPILMQDRSGERRSGKSKNRKEARRGRQAERERERERENEGKPYAGEGGMKKLLSRRRIEAADEEERRNMDEGEPKTRRETRDVSVHTDLYLDPLPSAATKETAPPSRVSTPNGGIEQSSLRVGRTRTQRSHVSSTRVPNKSKFSAAYEDVDGDGDAEDEERKEHERKELEEAAKKVPEFKIPPGFSFANDATSSIPPAKQQQVEMLKDPPIASLPLAFEKPSGCPSPFGVSAVPSIPVNGTPRRPSITTDFSVPVELSNPPLEEALKPVSAFAPLSQPPLTRSPAPPNLVAPSMPPESLELSAPSTASGVPNFFANSTLLTKPLPVASPQMKFDKESESSPHLPAPVRDTENPLWNGKEGDGNSTQSSGFVFDGTRKPAAELAFGGPSSKPVAGPFGSPPNPNGGSSFNDDLTRGRSTSAVSGFSFGARPKPDGSSLSSQQPVLESTPSATPTLFTPVKEAASPLSISSPNPFMATLQTEPSTTKGPCSFVQQPAEPPKDEPRADAAKPPPLFGNVPAFNFSTPSSITLTTGPAPELPRPAFSFGQSSAPPIVSEAPKPLFVGTGGFSFGQPSPSTPTPALPAQDKVALKTPFSFGAPPSTPSPVPVKKPAFSFGAPSPAVAEPAIGSSFSLGSNTTVTDAPKSFSFSSGTTVSRPVTPPKNTNNEQEMRMEESPSRDTQVKAPTTNGFSFGGSALFGQSVQGQGESSSPFTFGEMDSNPFGTKAEAKPQEIKPTMGDFGGFGQQTSSSDFSFGQQKVLGPEPARPSTAGAFSFGAQTPASTQSSFTFGGPTTTAGNAFNTQPTSAPSSPSTFNQPGGFSFISTNAQPTSSGFVFGASQPASPVNGNASQVQPLTHSSGGFSFGQGTGGESGQTSPFSVAAPTGGALFTIGSAPPAQRQIKKLPNRRMGGAKR